MSVVLTPEQEAAAEEALAAFREMALDVLKSPEAVAMVERVQGQVVQAVRSVGMKVDTLLPGWMPRPGLRGSAFVDKWFTLPVHDPCHDAMFDVVMRVTLNQACDEGSSGFSIRVHARFSDSQNFWANRVLVERCWEVLEPDVVRGLYEKIIERVTAKKEHRVSDQLAGFADRVSVALAP
jgi:hypothetical protein